MAQEVETQDLVSVGSRVSWGAILAGAFIALTLCIFLTALGTAVGVTIFDNVRTDQLAVGAGIWSLVTLLVSLFVGGYVASRCTVGERKNEAMMYGVLVWAVLIGVMATAAAVGQNAYLNFSNYLAQTGTTLSQQRPVQFTPEQYQQAGVNAEAQRKLNEISVEADRIRQTTSPTTAAWWAFAGIGFSLFAAIGGALLGAGPELVLRYWSGRRAIVTTAPPQPHM
jgi:hypothetical protein